MLEQCSEVQFNLNTKQCLSCSGVREIIRKNMAFTFEEMKHISTYKYPEDFASIKAAQVGTHREGVKDGQALFSKYRPDQCITLLKEA